MSVEPFFSPKFRAFDSNGDPLSGGLLYSYSAGTTTPLSTYTTRAGSVANANPVVLDANGEADVWTTPAVNYKFVLKNSAGVTQWTVDNYPSPSEVAASSADAAGEPGGRLSLTSSTPVTTSDVTGATTVYYVPYKHDAVPLYDGSTWALSSITTQLSQTTGDSTKSPAAVVLNSNYDLFVWNDSGTLRLSRGPPWTSDTARGTGAGTTEIARLNGRYVNSVAISNGPAAQRGLYVGSIRSDASAQINDSLLKRHVWNNHNRIGRVMLATDATVSWTYDSATFRQANGAATNQIDLLRGLDEDDVMVYVAASLGNFDAANENFSAVGIGLDSTSTNSATVAGFLSLGAQSGGATHYGRAHAHYDGLPGLGRHYFAWLERSSRTGGVGGAEWYGTYSAAAVAAKSGISGRILA